MPPLPAFATNYEIMRSQDYVMVTFSSPTGEVIDGRMQTQEVQSLAFTHPRFLELAAAVAQIAASIQGPAPPRRLSPPTSAHQEKRTATSDRDDSRASASPGEGALGDWIVRH